MAKLQLRAGAFLCLTQKYPEPLLIKRQPLAFLPGLRPSNARKALDIAVPLRAGQPGRRAKSLKALAPDSPLPFQPAEQQGEVGAAVIDLLPDPLQEQERLFQRLQMPPGVPAGRISCARWTYWEWSTSSSAVRCFFRVA